MSAESEIIIDHWNKNNISMPVVPRLKCLRLLVLGQKYNEENNKDFHIWMIYEPRTSFFISVENIGKYTNIFVTQPGEGFVYVKVVTIST